MIVEYSKISGASANITLVPSLYISVEEYDAPC